MLVTSIVGHHIDLVAGGVLDISDPLKIDDIPLAEDACTDLLIPTPDPVPTGGYLAYDAGAAA